MLRKVIVFVLVVCNLLLVWKLNKCTLENSAIRCFKSISYEREQVLIEELNFTNRIIGKEVKLSNLKLVEDLSTSQLTPIIFVNKNVCSSCKDVFYLEMNKILADSLSFQENLKIVLLDENSETVGKGIEKYIERTFGSLYYLKSIDFKLPIADREPDIYFLMLNDELEVVSFFEFQVKYPDLLSEYFKALGKIYR